MEINRKSVFNASTSEIKDFVDLDDVEKDRAIASFHIFT